MANQINDTGKEHRNFGTGATRDNCDGKGLPSLMSPIALHELYVHLQHGAEKYDARNWEAGMPLCSILDSLMRHIFAELMGDTSENHLGAIMCNAMFYVHTKRAIEQGMLPAELDDLPKYQQTSDKQVKKMGDKRVKKFIDTYLGPVEVPHKDLTATEIAKSLCKCTATEAMNMTANLTKAEAEATGLFIGIDGSGPTPTVKSAEPEKKRVYMCHSIRGKKGLNATSEEMIDNNNKAIEAGEYLRQEHPEFDVYVPGDHDELIMIGYGNGTLSEKQILDIDCKIVERCDAIIMYTEDGYLSRGMVTEIKYAEKHKKRIWWYDGDKLWSSYCFAHMYPEEWKKVC